MPSFDGGRGPAPGSVAAASSAPWTDATWSEPPPLAVADRYNPGQRHPGDQTPVALSDGVRFAAGPSFIAPETESGDREFKRGRSWSGSTEESFPVAGQIVAQAEEWADLWRRLGRRGSAPEVDFSTEMAIAVFAGRRSSGGRVEILSVTEAGGKLHVYYRAERELDDGEGYGYQVILVPRSSSTPKYELVH